MTVSLVSLLAAIASVAAGDPAKALSSCGQDEVVLEVRRQAQDAINEAAQGNLRTGELAKAWGTASIAVRDTTTTGLDKDLGRFTCQSTLGVTSDFPPEIIWRYPSVRAALERLKQSLGATPAPQELRSTRVRYTAQYTDDKTRLIVTLEGHERFVATAAAVIGGRGLFRRLITLEEKAPRDPESARAMVGRIAAMLGDGGFVHPDAMLRDPLVQQKFKATMGDAFGALLENVSVASEVKLIGDWLVGTGCAPHMCSIEDGAFAISTWTGEVAAAIHTDGKYLFFGAPTARELPAPVYDWLRSAAEAKVSVPAPKLDDGACATMREIAKDQDLHKQAAVASSKSIVVCTSGAGDDCTSPPWDAKAPPVRVTVRKKDIGSGMFLSGYTAQLVDIDNDGTDDAWVVSVAGTLSCVSSLPLIAKRLPGGGYSFAYDPRLKALKLEGCGMLPEFLRFRNQTYLAIYYGGSVGPIRIASKSGTRECK